MMIKTGRRYIDESRFDWFSGGESSQISLASRELIYNLKDPQKLVKW